MKEKLTKQDRIFVENVVLTGNLTKSVQLSYGTKDRNYAAVKGHRLISKDNIAQAIVIKRESLKEALENQGVTPTKIAEKVDELLEATRGIYKNNNATKQIELVGEEPDYQSIDKGLKHATNIYGIESLDNKPKTNNTYNFIFNEQTQAEVRKINEVIKEQLTKPNAKENQTPV